MTVTILIAKDMEDWHRAKRELPEEPAVLRRVLTDRSYAGNTMRTLASRHDDDGVRVVWTDKSGEGRFYKEVLKAADEWGLADEDPPTEEVEQMPKIVKNVVVALRSQTAFEVASDLGLDPKTMTFYITSEEEGEMPHALDPQCVIHYVLGHKKGEYYEDIMEALNRAVQAAQESVLRENINRMVEQIIAVEGLQRAQALIEDLWGSARGGRE